MKKKLLIVLTLLLCAIVVAAQEPIYDHFVYLPAIVWGVGTAVPTVRPTLSSLTETPTFTATPTLTATATITVAQILP